MNSLLVCLDATIAGAHEATAQHGETAAPAQVEHHFICYVIKGGRLYEIGKRGGRQFACFLQVLSCSLLNCNVLLTAMF